MADTSSYLVPCPFCAEARHAAKILGDLQRFAGSVTQVEARPKGSVPGDDFLVARTFRVRCENCHDSGKAPAREAKAVFELIDWYVAQLRGKEPSLFAGQFVGGQTREEVSTQRTAEENYEA